MKTALLAGATGLVGGEVLKNLLNDNQYEKIISIGRKQVSVDSPKLEQLIVDFENLSESQEKLIADDVFCCLGTTMKKAGSKEKFRQVDCIYPLNLAEICLKNNAKKFLLVTAMGADKNSLFFYNKVKGEVEEGIFKLGYDSAIILRPSLILGERNQKRLGEDIAKALSGPLSFFLAGPLKKYKPIHAHEIAEGMVNLAHKEMKGFHVIESENIKKA